MLLALDELGDGRRAPASSGRPSPTRTCTPPSNAACSNGSARSAASCAPAAAATTRSRPTCGCTCATTPAALALADRRPRGRARRPGRAARGRRDARHDAPAARPARPARAPPARARARARPRRRPVARLGPPRRGLAARAPARSPARRCRWTPSAVARELGFDRPAANSIDAVADRDFAAEFLFVTALLGVHLSRIGEEVILWATPEFGWVRLDDAWSTGSSIMPQKKNPDIAELARGKSGRFIGNLTGLLATLKALPLAYDRDLQEDKEPVFDTVDQLLVLLPAVTGLVATLRFDTERLTGGRAGRVRAGHRRRRVAGARGRRRSARRTRSAARFVSYCEQRGLDLPDLDRRRSSPRSTPRLTPDVRDVLSVDGALRPARAVGGTAPDRVAEQLARPATPTSTASGPGPAPARLTRVTEQGRPAVDRCAAAGSGAGRRAAAARRRPGQRRRRRARGRPAHRGRGVRGRGRPRLARLPRPHAAHRGHVRPARPPLLLLHLRHALVRQRRVRPGRHGRRRCCCAPATVVEGVDAALRPATRLPRRAATSPAARPGWPPASASTATPNGVDLCDPRSPVRLESMPARRPPGVVERPAGRHQRRRRAAVALLARRRPDGVGVQGGRPTASRDRFGRLTP